MLTRVTCLALLTLLVAVALPIEAAAQAPLSDPHLIALDPLELELDAELRSIDEMARWSQGLYSAAVCLMVNGVGLIVAGFGVWFPDSIGFSSRGGDEMGIGKVGIGVLLTGAAMLIPAIALDAVSGGRRRTNDARRSEHVSSGISVAPLERGAVVIVARTF